MADVPSFNFNKILDGLSTYVNNVQGYLNSLQSSGSSGAISLGRMFHMQFAMEMMSQYIEATSNMMQGIHTEMITMARATKGQ